MPWTLIIALAVAALCFAGWILTEFDLREARHDIDELEELLAQTRTERDIAEIYAEKQLVADVAASSTLGGVLSVIEGGDS